MLNSNKKRESMPNNITFLGTGTSTGVPTPGCPCKLCQTALITPTSKNNRLRTSIFLETAQGKNILIDTTPDLRTQLLRYQITKIDAVIITHDHADHIHGIDDLRPLCFFQEKREIPLCTTPYTQGRLRERFDYIFANRKKIIGGGIPRLTLHTAHTNFTEQLIEQEPFYFFELPHGHITTLSFFHQGLAYLTDCQQIIPEAMQFLKQQEIKLLVIDSTRRKPHDTHIHLDLALEYIEQLQPKHARLIHMGHDFDHEALNQELRERNFLQTAVSFDGEVLQY
jgi:phosphoribosyl 1,2-cyclic phosphate phosphodiesterase